MLDPCVFCRKPAARECPCCNTPFCDNCITVKEKKNARLEVVKIIKSCRMCGVSFYEVKVNGD